MKIKVERLSFYSDGWIIKRKQEPWSTARIILSKKDKYIAFLIKRECLLTPLFKVIYLDAKKKLDKATKDEA